MADPFEYTSYLSLGKIGGTVQTLSQGLAEAGKIYTAFDGDRFYYNNAYSYCVYILVRGSGQGHPYVGKVMGQNMSSFALEISTSATYAGVNERLSSSTAVIQGFMDVFLGVLSCTSGPLAMSITGMNWLITAGTIKQNYDVYKKAIEVVLYHRDFIHQAAPTLEAVVISNLLLGRLEKVLSGQAKQALLGKVPGPKVAGKIFGVFLGSMGEEQFKNQLAAINKVFTEVLIPVVDHGAKTWPTKLSKQQISDLAKHVAKWVKLAGHLQMDQGTGELIVKEVADNPLGLQGPLKKISAALSLK